jgi:hypothetical protein
MPRRAEIEEGPSLCRKEGDHGGILRGKIRQPREASHLGLEICEA